MNLVSPLLKNNIMKKIFGTGKFPTMPKGIEFEVSEKLAKTLINKGAATETLKIRTQKE